MHQSSSITYTGISFLVEKIPCRCKDDRVTIVASAADWQFYTTWLHTRVYIRTLPSPAPQEYHFSCSLLMPKITVSQPLIMQHLIILDYGFITEWYHDLPKEGSTNATETRLFKVMEWKLVILDLSTVASLLVSVRRRSAHQRISFFRHCHTPLQLAWHNAERDHRYFAAPA